VILMTLAINVLSVVANIISHYAQQHGSFELHGDFSLDSLLGGALFIFWVASSMIIIIPTVRRKKDL